MSNSNRHIYRPSERVSNCVDKVVIAMLKQNLLSTENELRVRHLLQIEILRAVVDIQNDTYANSVITPIVQVEKEFEKLVAQSYGHLTD